MTNSSIVFIFLLGIGILFIHFKIQKINKQIHQQKIGEVEVEIMLQKEKYSALNAYCLSKETALMYHKIEIIKQQIACLEMISHQKNRGK